jgi:hypothetical protein
VVVELQEQLHAQKRELDSRDGTIIVWEEGLAAFVRTHREVCTKQDASRARVDAIQWDFFTQARASSSRSK